MHSRSRRSKSCLSVTFFGSIVLWTGFERKCTPSDANEERDSLVVKDDHFCLLYVWQWLRCCVCPFVCIFAKNVSGTAFVATHIFSLRSKQHVVYFQDQRWKSSFAAGIISENSIPVGIKKHSQSNRIINPNTGTDPRNISTNIMNHPWTLHSRQLCPGKFTFLHSQNMTVAMQF